MRTKLLLASLLFAACGDDPNTQRLDGGFIVGDASEFAPMLVGFVASPMQVTAGVPTEVTWNWAFAQEPTFPTPTCSIDNGVGTVEKGQAVEITISQVTTFTLTCTNSAGMSQRQVVVGVPPVAPVLETFTATPASTMSANQAGNITFAWTYSNTPTPLPTCIVDGGIGAVTNGQTVSVTLPQARTYRLRCSNGAGFSFLDAARIPVTECGITSHCAANATCTDTAESYTCSCATGYTGDGNTCSFVTANAGDCDANATHNGTACVCDPGYVGNGTTCTRALLAFTTTNGFSGSSVGGLAGADATCQTTATNAGLPGTYRAWLSDSSDDAYCRMHGLSGKKSNNCGQASLPTSAGPWVRYEPTTTRRPFAPTIDKLTGPNRQLFYPAVYTQAGSEHPTATRVWTGTDENGVYVANATCGDWSTTSGGGVAGYVHGGPTTWTKGATTPDVFCTSVIPLRCMEVGSGPPLPPRHPTSSFRRAFVTSVTGNGNLQTWPDSNNQTNITAADQICQARARYAGYTNALNFKAWASTTLGYISSRIVNTTLPYVRPDGVVLGTGRADMLDGKILATWSQTETGSYATGTTDSGYVWTGSTTSGVYTSNCASFTSSTSSGYYGRVELVDSTYLSYSTAFCDQTYRLYCVED